MSLSDKQLEHVCLLWDIGPKTCRYLQEDDQAMNKFYCCKLHPAKKKNIDKKLNAYLQKCQDTGKNPEDDNVFLGNNCPGYLLLKNTEQGYDV